MKNTLSFLGSFACDGPTLFFVFGGWVGVARELRMKPKNEVAWNKNNAPFEDITSQMASNYLTFTIDGLPLGSIQGKGMATYTL